MLEQFTVTFKTDSDHAGFLRWLCAYEAENKLNANARISFIRLPGTFSRWRVAPERELDAIKNAATAYGGEIEEFD